MLKIKKLQIFAKDIKNLKAANFCEKVLNNKNQMLLYKTLKIN